MLKSKIELAPSGDEASIRELGCMYLANMGRSSGSSDHCDYLIGYFEKSSEYSRGFPILKFKRITKYNRMAPAFEMMQKVYDKEDWFDFYEIKPTFTEYESRVANSMLKRMKIPNLPI